MAASFQQQSRLRKIIYFGLIGLLFTAMVVFRKSFVEPKATALEMREENIGEVELTGSAVRLLMTGSRGFAVCVLWNTAMDKQMKHEWNELEMIVNSITKLQPHFVTPWLFQSWNLAYNVSVESDRVKDKFFYVTRGIDLLGEGERRIKNDPDLRNHMAWYYQNKFGLSDENNTFRSLFQLACIDPKLRDPLRFRKRVSGEWQFNLEEFEKFCREQPQLVKRLRDRLRAKTPELVVEFLDENKRIPNRFDESPDVAHLDRSPYKQPPDKRFPLLPPPGAAKFNPNELDNDSDLPYDTDNFDLARVWYGYAQDPLSLTPPRRPRQLSQVIFESYPARAQAYKADILEKNGWIDPQGWTITDWFPLNRAQPSAAKRPVVVGNRTDGKWWSQEAWERAYDMYVAYGRRKDMMTKTPTELSRLDPQQQQDYDYNRRVTNFLHFLNQSEVERTREAAEARRCFYLAEQARRNGDRPEALRWYENDLAFGPPSSWANPLKGWKKVFLDHPDFRSDSEVQQDTYEIQNKYLKLVDELRGPTVRRLLLIEDILGQAALRGPGETFWRPPVHWMKDYPLILNGPFDGVDKEGKPLIFDYVVGRVRGDVVRNFAGEPPPPTTP